MRIAMLIIALCLTMIVGMQSCTVMMGGGLSENEDMAGGGAVGLLIALLFVLGAAFALGAPKVSMWLFGVAAGMAFLVAQSSGFSDLNLWGVVSAALAVMSHLGARELKPQAHPATMTMSPIASPAPAYDPNLGTVSHAGSAISAQPSTGVSAIFENYMRALRLYARGTGRASRAEFWHFSLVFAVAMIAMLIVDATLFGPETGASPLAGIFNIAHIIPGIAVFVRRLHDTDRSGWWYLLALTGIGLIPLIIFVCQRGTAGANRFGADPLADTSTVPVPA
jgi:uncharacterized membrane protein YhaH (DUF805 family)